MTVIKKVTRGDGDRFQAYGYKNGRKVYLGTHDTERKAKHALEEHRVTKRKIEDGRLPPETDDQRTFGTAVKSWLTRLEERASPSHSEYANRNDLYLLPTFASVPIVDVTRSSVLQWRDELSTTVSNATANTVLMTLSAAFSYFVEREWLQINPCRGIRQLKVDQRVYPWLQSTDAITRLLGELAPKWRTLVAVLVGTGCRLDEALRCTWDDVDMEHRIITLRKTKANKVRRVPIFDSVLVVLREMRLARGTEALLWPGGRPGVKLSQPSIRKPFKAAVLAAGLPPELRLHDLRHTFASLFLADGGDIFKLSRILGHSSVAITERCYAHLKPTAYAEDYGRVAFRMPVAEGANVVKLRA